MAGGPRGRGTRRIRPQRQLAKRILVVTEGTETEPQYVERLGGFLRSKGATAIVKKVGVGTDPLKVVRKCVEIRDRAQGDAAFDICVCLVDVDQHATLPAACKLAKQESILLLISNLKFEVWLRWHAEDKRSALTTTQLDHRVEQLNLASGKTLLPRFPIDRVYAACDTARKADPGMAACRMGPGPSSAMPLLVDLLKPS
ncbi:RloB family protein [Streptomyces sp. NBC_00525]|uniref:RloB family protein n=1 Tax=Streptomyces sp. NBC_00525 TaxID=2903660 RepID=UPI002E820A84|nr:RloB family protein [Streptomyces sp. NBC_00525]WUC95138.1 RloB family protein [Streptomyces sp. NBC_00525]